MHRYRAEASDIQELDSIDDCFIDSDNKSVSEGQKVVEVQPHPEIVNVRVDHFSKFYDKREAIWFKIEAVLKPISTGINVHCIYASSQGEIV